MVANMWDEENGAETVTIHPWTSVNQPQVWRGSNAASSSAALLPRGWDGGGGGGQPGPQPSGWAPQMAWAPPSGAPPTGAGWQMPQPQPQWAGPSPAFADKIKRAGGGMQPSTSAPRFDGAGGVPAGGVGGWGGGAVKVDQQTPWDTTGSSRWGQPAALGMPRVVSNKLWPPNGALINGIPAGAPVEWSSNASITSMSAAAAAAAAMHRNGPLPPPQIAGGGKMPPYDLTGTAHWKTPPPPAATAAAAMMAIMPPGAGAPAILPTAVAPNWCQPGGMAGAPPLAPDPLRLPFDASGTLPGPNQWTEMNNDMMWHDPNPKEKKMQRDTGTAVWGDPCVQCGEIRRWKEVDQVPDYPAPPSGADWASMPLNVEPVAVPPPPLPVNGSGEASADGSPSGGAPPPPAVAGWDESTGRIGGDTSTRVWAANAAGGYANGSTAGGWSSAAAIAAAAGGKQLSAEELVNLGKKLQQYQQQHRVNGRQQITPQQQVEDGPTTAPNTAAIIAVVKKYPAAFRQPPGAAAAVAVGKPDALQWAARTLDALRKAREQELVKLMRTGADQSEQSRLYEEIQRIKTDIFDLNAVMFNNNGENNNNDSSNNSTGNNNTGNNNNGATLSQKQQQQQQMDNGQSRLQQWRKTAGGGRGSGEGSPRANGAPADATAALLAATQSLSINAGPSPADGTGERAADWKSGMLDWSAPSTVGSGDSFVDVAARLSQGNNSMNGFEPVGDETAGGAKNSLLDDGPPEFVPGKKWEWRDPNKVAEDPNATPGTCKPNPLLSLQRTFASGGGLLDNKSWSNGGRAMASTKLSGADFGGSAPASYYWVLIQMVDMSKQQVQAICGRVGHLLLFMVVGHKVACVKFAEPNPTGILQRLKAEFMISAQYLKVVSDEEFEKIIRRSYDNDVPITSRWSVAELAAAGGGGPNTATPDALPAGGAATF